MTLIWCKDFIDDLETLSLQKGGTLNLRELIQKPYWGPKELSIATGISITTARNRLATIRKELTDQGYINLNNSKAPTRIIIERLNFDVKFLEENGGLDKDISM